MHVDIINEEAVAVTASFLFGWVQSGVLIVFRGGVCAACIPLVCSRFFV